MGWELHIGPYRGRDAALHEAARGILANPMELAEASKIPIATIADYLADPTRYDPEASIARAIRKAGRRRQPRGWPRRRGVRHVRRERPQQLPVRG